MPRASAWTSFITIYGKYTSIYLPASQIELGCFSYLTIVLKNFS